MTNSERVVNRYGELVYRICYVRLAGRDHAAIDDAYQNVFLSYLEKPPKAEPDSDGERAWFARCAVNRCNDVYRQKKNGILSLDAQLDGDNPQNEPVSYDEPQNAALEALLALPEKYRMAMYFHYVVGCDCEECAKLLGITSAAVRMRLMRGRSLFAKEYGIYEAIEGGTE